MPSSTGSIQDNKKRVLVATYPALPSVSSSWRQFMKDYLTAQVVSFPASATLNELEHLYYAQRCVANAIFANLAATQGYSVNGLRRRWLIFWAGTIPIPTAQKSNNDLELAYWRSL